MDGGEALSGRACWNVALEIAERRIACCFGHPWEWPLCRGEQSLRILAIEVVLHEFDVVGEASPLPCGLRSEVKRDIDVAMSSFQRRLMRPPCRPRRRSCDELEPELEYSVAMIDFDGKGALDYSIASCDFIGKTAAELDDDDHGLEVSHAPCDLLGKTAAQFVVDGHGQLVCSNAPCDLLDKTAARFDSSSLKKKDPVVAILDRRPPVMNLSLNAFHEYTETILKNGPTERELLGLRRDVDNLDGLHGRERSAEEALTDFDGHGGLDCSSATCVLLDKTAAQLDDDGNGALEGSNASCVWLDKTAAQFDIDGSGALECSNCSRVVIDKTAGQFDPLLKVGSS
eukprot:TRINITY_DN40819_c0_g1_i1.p1 TRINITY_DN40819_c0_g1~~TRINITY_DN40819_c0_g1_i1.p1  ORF type:complete len:383 (-),score=74.79 TRINITY_DN40819_c0_g1_i1:193-1221(-)